MSMNSNICWICGIEPARTGEHQIKRSDLDGVLTAPSQIKPLYRHDVVALNVEIPGLNSKILKFPESLCAPCNNARTQPHDRAWERMSEYVRAAAENKTLSTHLDASQIFDTDYVSRMLDVHLFFVKHLGCCIRHFGIGIEIAPLSNAITTGTACPFVHLKFGLSPVSAHRAELSNMEIERRTSDGQFAVAAYIYSVGVLNITVMFVSEGEKVEGLIDSWHPDLGTETLIPLTNLV